MNKLSVAPSKFRVGYIAKLRLTVYDSTIQPDNPELMLIYSVHGHQLCLRCRAADESRIDFDVPKATFDFALAQYKAWLEDNQHQVAVARNATAINTFPAIRKICPSCEGMGTWMDRQNKCSYGVTQEEENIIERCGDCRGNGFVEDLL